MQTEGWSATVVSPDATLSTALRSMNATALQIVIVLDDGGRLQGTLTDGDVRRALLRGENLNCPVSTIMKVDPITIVDGTGSQDALDLLRRMAIQAAPVVDAEGRVVDLITVRGLIAPAERNTPAVIMAGGRGSRLRPLTDTIPKPLMSISGELLIDITVRRLVSHGFRHIWVTTHYRANDIKEHLGDGQHLHAEVQYITETEPLGTVGAVRQVPASSVNTPILVCNSDNVHAIDFGDLVDHHISSGAWATLAVVQHITEVPFGVVNAQNGFITDLVEKPQRSDWVASGVSVMTQRALSLFPEGQRLDVPTVISELLNQGLPAGAFHSYGYWSDVGDPLMLARVRSEHEGERRRGEA